MRLLTIAWQRQRRNIATLAFLAALAGVALWAWRADPLGGWSLRLTDTFLPREEASNSIVLVLIDDATLDRYGAITLWPRTLHAQAVDRLREAGARVIAYDILFAEAKSGDDELRAAMEEVLIVLPVAGRDPLPTSAGGQYSAVERPTSSLADAAAGLGHVNIVLDGDGIVRRIPAEIVTAAGERYPALAAIAADRYLRAVAGPVPTVEGGWLRLAGRSAPLEDDGKLRIAFAGNLRRFRSVSFVDVINGVVPPEAVAGKLVIIGMTAVAAADYHATPTGRMAGVTLQANVVDALLKSRFLQEVALAPVLLAGLLVAGALSVVMTRRSLAVGVGATLGFLGAYVLASWLLPLAGWIIDPLYVPLLLGVSLAGSLLWRLESAQSERIFFWNWFRRVAPPEILSELERGGLEALRGFEVGELRLRRFLIIDEVGSGTTGVVYKARDLRDKERKLVAIKRLYPHLARNQKALERFRREANVLRRLRSPNVVRLFDFVEDEKPPLLVTEYVEGRSLEELLEQEGPMAAVEAAKIVAQAAQGLADALSQQVLHRDVKPANILLSKEGVAKVTDFGLAAIDEQGAPEATLEEGFVGTVRYAAPEAAAQYGLVRAVERPVDARSDVYSLGLVLYELVMGEPAFPGSTVFEVFASRAEWVLSRGTPFDTYPGLLQILQRCLAEDPDARFRHAGELAEALRLFLARKEAAQ